MAEQPDYDEEERAWALRVARAFLAPPGESSVASRQSPDDEGLRPVVVLAALVVPLAVPATEARGVGREARGARREAREDDEHEEGEHDG